MAFLIFDRTGVVCMECKERYPEFKLIGASPASTSFVEGDYSFSLEQMAARVVIARSGHDVKEFGTRAKPFYEIVLRQLEVSVITRLGLRQLYCKLFPEPDGATTFIQGLKIEPELSDSMFGINSPSQELVLRWEAKQHGATLHLAPIPGGSMVPVIDVRQFVKGYTSE